MIPKENTQITNTHKEKPRDLEVCKKHTQERFIAHVINLFSVFMGATSKMKRSAPTTAPHEMKRLDGEGGKGGGGMRGGGMGGGGMGDGGMGGGRGGGGISR